MALDELMKMLLIEALVCAIILGLKRKNILTSIYIDSGEIPSADLFLAILRS